MASNSPNLPPNDPKVIAEIVDKLKKQGLFDKFRKDCLADVDTKPAYQNLCRRVDTFCANFLRNIRWTPDLNKNKLRDSLRNEITQGKMLSGGVDHIVSQVVNPKIQKFFKPDIDAVVCEFFGIDPEERAQKLQHQEEQRAERYKQLALESPTKQRTANTLGHMSGTNQQSFPGVTNFGMQSMMGVAGYMVNQMQQQQQPAAAMPSAVNIASMTGISTSMAQSIQNTLSQMPGGQIASAMFPNMPPTIPNFSVPPPGFAATAPTYDPSVPPPNISQAASTQNFTSLLPNFATAATTFQQIPGLPGMTFSNQMLLSGMTASEIVGGYGMLGAMASSLDASPVKPEKKDDKTIDKEKKKKEVPTLTVEDLLNVALPTKASRERNKKERDRHRGESQGVGRSDSGSPVVHSRRDASSKAERRGEDRRSDRSEDKPDRRGERSDERRLDDRRSDRSEDRRSDYSGSYHSDVSRSDRGRADEYHGVRSPGRSSGGQHDLYRTEGKQPPEPPGGKPPSPPPEPKEKVYHFAWDDVETGAVSEMTISSVHTSDLSSFDEGSSDASGLEDISSDELRSEDEAGTKPPEPPEPPKDDTDTTVNSDGKELPQNPVGLKYNYSDSEDEETREERKNRIAEEKEERYLKRQLRRAELEARKEEKKEKKAAEKKKAEDIGAVLPPEPDADQRPSTRERRLRAARTKEALKEQLRAEKREQKVQQRVMDQRMALRRQRKRNSKYMSDEFTSIFTDKRKILSNEGYLETGQDPDYSPTHDICDTRDTRNTRRAPTKVEPLSPSTPTQDEMEYSYHGPEVIEVPPVPAAPVRKRVAHVDDHAGGRPTTPFSDGSEKTELEQGRGRRRRRTLSGRHSPEPEKPVRPQEPPPLQEQRAHSQRYDDSDLYKPHTSYRTRRRGTSPLLETPSTGRLAVGWVDSTPPPPVTRSGRPPSPPAPSDEYRTGPGWQRHASQESFKTGRTQHFQTSQDKHFPSLVERPTKAPITTESRPGLYPPRASPDRAANSKFHQRAAAAGAVSTKPTHPPTDAASAHSGDDAPESSRPKVPLSHINFGEAAKQARTYVRNVTKTPPPPPVERPPDEFVDFGEAERQARHLKASVSPISNRANRRAAQSTGVTGNQRSYRRGGMSPRGETFHGSFKRERFQRGDQHSAVPSLLSFGIISNPSTSMLRTIPTPTTQGAEREDPRLSDRGDNSTWGSEREARDRSDYHGARWTRPTQKEGEDWQKLLKVKSLEEEKEEWESISDDEDLGDNFEEGHVVERRGNQTDNVPDWNQDRSHERESPVRSENSGSQERPREQSYNSAEEVSQDRVSLREERDRYAPQERFPAEVADRPPYRPEAADLEEGEEVEESQHYMLQQPPEPPPQEEEQRPSRKRRRSDSVSSVDDVAELPRPGMSPTAKHDKLTEMPRPGMSPSERESPSRSLTRLPPMPRLVPRSPPRSMSPMKLMRRSPTRSMPRSPPRLMPRSPTKSMPRSPTRSMPRSPTRSMPRSPTRSMPRSPTRSIPRSPTRSMPRSPTRSMTRSPTRSMTRSSTRSVPRSQAEPQPSYGGPATPPDHGPPPSPMRELMSSPESGEVGDFDSTSEKGPAAARSPFTSPEPDHSPSPPRRHDMSDWGDGRSPSPSGSSQDRYSSQLRGANSARGARGAGLGAHPHQGLGRDMHGSGPGSAIPTTRSSRRRSEEESMPIAKRLRR